MICQKCGFKNDDEAGYCGNCGDPLKSSCLKCGNWLKPGTKFCTRCGFPVQALIETSGRSERLATLREATPAALQEKIRSSLNRVEGQRKPVTILFADIVGSTGIAEKLDPEEWGEIVSCAHQRLSQPIYRYEGTIAQLLGDGVLAFFGAPITHEDDPLRAVRAALDIQASIAEYSQELKGYVENFQMRIGINTGLVVISNVGSDLHMEYLAVGDAVNMAARLQSTAQPGKVLISENTARLVSTAFTLHDLGEVSLKGKEETVKVYEVLEMRDLPESGRGYEELRSPVIGRQEELSLLRIAFESLLAGHGQVVSLIGEAGIGKSRLLEEIRNLLAQGLDESSPSVSPFQWIEGRALSYGRTLSYWSITQLIKNDLGLSDGDPELKIRISLRKRLIQLFGQPAPEMLPYLSNLLDIQLEERASDSFRILDGEALKRQTLVSIKGYFEQVAKMRPTVLVFDDLHWIDPSSLQALQELLPLTDRVPLMLVLLFRPERDLPSWKLKLQLETDYAHRYTEIFLQPLSPDDQIQLVNYLLTIVDLPDQIQQLIIARAEGNPLYLEEIVRSLIEQGGIVWQGDHWSLTGDIERISIPNTLQGVLLARIDRLEEEVRRTLQLAAVIGKSFLYRLLEAISAAERELESHLAILQRVDLVREKSRLPELEYMFKHSLTQEAAYNSLLAERRRVFHLLVGEALESLFPERKNEFLGMLAHHFDLAGEQEKTLQYLVWAGDRARMTDEHLEAIDFYKRAIEIFSDTGDELNESKVWLKLGMVYNANFQFDDTRLAFAKAFQLQQKVRLAPKPTVAAPGQILRICHPFPGVTLDPGVANWLQDTALLSNLFSGLVSIDADLNVLPDIAHSWQVLDGGKRFVFHLRDDVFWSDGARITAADFVWTWKRNLDPELGSEIAAYLFDIEGAQEFHEGKNTDPESVGVRALNSLTLEISLVEPVAYFLYILSLPVAYPLQRSTLEQHKDTWWNSGKMVSNGAFRLVKYNSEVGGVIERNPSYHGEYPGNLERVEWTVAISLEDRLKKYRENCTDLVYLREFESSEGLPPSDRLDISISSVFYLMFGIGVPPFNDLRVRKALIHALDKHELSQNCGITAVYGGLVPPKLPGHSPDIGLPFDLEVARQLLAEAGYPGGIGFPSLKGYMPFSKISIGEEISRQWRQHLGIEAAFEELFPAALRELKEKGVRFPFLLLGEVLDFPDPDTLLRKTSILDNLRFAGWQDDDYDQQVEMAARTAGREKRMAIYRKADHYLVSDQALILPLSYTAVNDVIFCKQWVKNYQLTPLGHEKLSQVLVEEHT